MTPIDKILAHADAEAMMQHWKTLRGKERERFVRRMAETLLECRQESFKHHSRAIDWSTRSREAEERAVYNAGKHRAAAEAQEAYMTRAIEAEYRIQDLAGRVSAIAEEIEAAANLPRLAKVRLAIQAAVDRLRVTIDGPG